MITRFGKTLKKGDCIVVAYNNYLWPAIFLEYGPKGNARYILFIRKKFIEKDPNKKVYIDYMTRKAEKTIAKISISDLSDEYYEDYLFLSNYIKERQL